MSPLQKTRNEKKKYLKAETNKMEENLQLLNSAEFLKEKSS